MAKKEQAQAPAKKKKGQQEAAAFTEPARLRVKYKEEVAPAMHEKFATDFFALVMMGFWPAI